MNKQAAKKLVSLLTALALALGTVFVTTDKVSAEEAAASPVEIWNDYPLWVGQGTGVGYSADEPLDWDWFYENAKLISIVSENETVLTVEADSDTLNSIYMMANEVGNSEVTLTYELEGQTYTINTVYEVKAYPWAVKKATFNGKKIKINEGDNYYQKHNYKKDNIKTKIVPKAGWTINKVYGTMANGDNYKDVKISKKAIKKGLEIKYPKKYDAFWITIQLKNKKGDIFEYEVSGIR